MNWVQVLTIVLANIGWSTTMFLWLRKEANADRKELAAATNASSAEFRRDMTEFRKMWAQETKEFHARLCLSEEKIKRNVS